MRRINQRLNRPNSLSLTARKAAAAKDGTCGAVRIVGGIWRRTPLQVASRPGLRPTPERVRETVFDWMGHLFGAEDLQLRAIAAALPALRGDGLIYVEQPKTPVSAEALRRLGLTRVRLSVAGEVVFELLTRTDSPMAAQAKFAKKILRDMQQKGVEL